MTLFVTLTLESEETNQGPLIDALDKFAGRQLKHLGYRRSSLVLSDAPPMDSQEQAKLEAGLEDLRQAWRDVQKAHNDDIAQLRQAHAAELAEQQQLVAKLRENTASYQATISELQAGAKPASKAKPSLVGVRFSSKYAREAAVAAGLDAEDFKRRKASGTKGFTKADVERLAT